MQPNINPQQLSDKTIAIDCLVSCKAESARDAYSIMESAHPQVRQMFQRMNADHLRMQYEMFQYAQRHGWYPVPQATQQAMNQLPQFQPAQAQGSGGFTAAAAQPGQTHYQPNYAPQSAYGGQASFSGQSQTEKRPTNW